LKEFADATASREGGVASGAKGDLGDGTFTNASIIEMLRAGLPEDVILTSINSAKDNSFDVSPKGLIQLAEAKASKKLIQRVQAIASGAKDTPVAAKAAVKKQASKKP
jgi:hypothetical protein